MHGEGPLLVLAGAGSGKTRVITYRIAYLVGNLGVHPTQILAVTFTNKAAAEMLERINKLVPYGGGRPMIGTFHSTALRVLRKYADKLGYTSSFVVYDTADQMTLIRRCMRELQLDHVAGKSHLVEPCARHAAKPMRRHLILSKSESAQRGV